MGEEALMESTHVLFSLPPPPPQCSSFIFGEVAREQPDPGFCTAVKSEESETVTAFFVIFFVDKKQLAREMCLANQSLNEI